MKILVGADIRITENNTEMFVKGDAKGLVGEKLLNILKSADYRIFNLEGALTEREEPIKKCGPNLKMDPKGVVGMKALGVDLLSAANNHILDEGKNGFIDTLKYLDEAGLAHVGGGMTKEECKKLHIIEKEGKKIGVYACCEHEFSWIDDYGIGCNGFEDLDTPDEIAEAKKKVDYLIVLYHGGREQYRYPFPYLKKRCRKMVEKGADFVICQHTHCVGCREEYKGGEIVYGQGNFLFCHSCEDEYWKNGILAEINIEGDKVSYDYIPYEQDCKGGIRYSEDASILEGFRKRSEDIKDESFVDKAFDEYVSVWGRNYILDLAEMPEKHHKAINFIECEPHRNILLYALKKPFMAEDKNR